MSYFPALAVTIASQGPGSKARLLNPASCMSALTALHVASFVSFIKYCKRQVSDIEVSVAPVVSIVCLFEASVTGKAKKCGDYGCDGT